MSSGPVSEQLLKLVEIQELDRQIDHINQQISTLPKDIQAIDRKLAVLMKSIKQKSDVKAEIDKTHKQTTAAMELNADRIARSTKNQDAVENTKQFAAVKKEVEQLEKMNAELEAKKKVTTEELEKINAELEKLETEQGTLQSEKDKVSGTIETQQSELNSSLKELTGNRDVHAKDVQVGLLRKYDRIRGARGGLGIVPAVAGRCKGCNMMLPPQTYNLIQKGNEAFSCPSCHRLLFVAVDKATEDKPPLEDKKEAKSS